MNYTLKERQIKLVEDYDVIVIGGGPAGCAAAASSAREGAKTLLIESSGMLGGMATKGLVSSWTPYTDEIRIIYGGISKKVFLETKNAMEVVAPDHYDWVAIDYERLKMVYDDLINESGADVLFHTYFCDVEMKDERNVDKIIVANKSGLTAYKAKVYIDCTGDADLYAFAGGKYHFGDDETHETQPASHCFVISGVSQEEFEKATERLNGKPLYAGNPNAVIHKIVEDEKYNIPDTHCVCCFIGPNTMGFNAGHIWDVDYTNPECVSKAIFEGRKLAQEYFNAFKEYLPEVFKDAYLVETAPTLGCRESRRIIGDYIFTVEDFQQRRSFPDEIARNNYFIDIHKSAKENNEMKGHSDNRYEHYKAGESHGIPYRVLCPKQFDNMLVAGRSVSTDRITQGSLRVMPCCLCEGEAAGIAANYAIEKDEINIHTIDTQRLRKRLIELDGYLPKLETDTF